MYDTLTAKQIELGFLIRADYIGLDDCDREIYEHPSGRRYAMIDGSLYNKPILYTISKQGEPDYPIKIDGRYVTFLEIAGDSKKKLN